MRKSSREIAAQPVPVRIKSLFHGEEDVYAPKRMELIHSQPNVYLIRDFLTQGEISYFDKICTVHSRSFKASFTEDGEKNEVISEERTSSHVHLTKGQDSTVRSIERRAAELVGLSSPAVEPLQIVSYRDGQKFDVHHDAGTMLEDGTIELVTPRRLVTFFVYLNNLPPNQGHTEFPSLNLSVHPERGSAVVFCNVLPDGNLDNRTIHCAQPVTGNLRKYGINIWICDCDMQGLAQVKAHCTVNSEQTITPTQSALTNAERLTMKYNYEQSIASSKSMQKAIYDTNNNYWTDQPPYSGNKKQKIDNTASKVASKDNEKIVTIAKKEKVKVVFRKETPIEPAPNSTTAAPIINTTGGTRYKREKSTPKEEESEGETDYASSITRDLFSYSPDYWADYSYMGGETKKQKVAAPLRHVDSSNSLCSNRTNNTTEACTSTSVPRVGADTVINNVRGTFSEKTNLSTAIGCAFVKSESTEKDGGDNYDLYSFLNTRTTC